jgi:protein SCO1/2
MADFTLLDQNGQPRKLSDSRGKSVLIFYGYTHCPDVCPLSMADFKRIKADISTSDPALASQVDFVMISVDGERDTPEVMKRYVEAFDPQFIGLTGPSSEVAAIGKDYGVRFEKQKPVGTQAAYLMAHTSFTYLLDAQGYWQYAFPFGTPPEQIAQELLRVLRPQ